MKVSLRSQFYFLVIPFVGALAALLVAALAPYLAVHSDVLRIERELAHTLAIQGFADSFIEQSREYADLVVTGAHSDIEDVGNATLTSRRSLAAWRVLAAEDGASDLEIVRRVSADHARVTELGATIVRLRGEGRQAEAVAVLTDQVLPLVTEVSQRVDQSLQEHHAIISRHIARITGGIGYSRFLQMGGMLEGIEDLDSHVAEVLDSVAYKSAIEREVRGYWYFFLSKGRLHNDMAADHERVNRAFTAWRLTVKGYVGTRSFGGPEQMDELRVADDIHRGYFVLHADGEKITQLVERGSHDQAQVLLQQALQFENTAIAKTMQKYTAHETVIAAQNLDYLRREARRAYRTLLAIASVILLMGLGVPWILSRRMIKPILDLQQAALRIGRGELETRIVVPPTVELASLATTFNAMAGELKISRNEDLKKSEERFQLAARSSNDVIWDWDVRLDQLWLDEAYRESVGLQDQCLSVSQWLESIHPDDRQRLERGIRGVLTGTDHFWSDEYRFRRVDGTYAQKVNRGYIVREDGKAVRMIGAVTDITERRNAEQAIANLHRQKEMILNSVGDGIVGLDRQGNITSVNPAAAAMFACEENDLLGMPVRQVVHRGDIESSSHRWESSPICTTLVEGTRQSSDEELFFRADRSSFPADYVSNPMCDDDGNVIGAVVTFRDITEKHEVDRLKSQFVATVSHELRTPLTSIRGALGLLSAGLLGSVSTKGQRMLEIAVANTDRLVRLINDILDVERIESGKMEMSRAEAGALDLMKRAVESVQSMADEAGVRLVVEPSSASVMGDGDRIIQTLTNLLGNAIKFSPRETTVSLSAADGGRDCTFRVADQGRGVPDDKLEMIFERFQQVDASDSRDKGGSGLGLAICRSIVNAHGGRIWAQKNEPAGTVFQFTIPSATAPAARGVGPAPRTLMVCQENDSAMPNIVPMLENHGFHVLRCLEADVAARVSEAQPDAIILDLASNGGHGWQVVESLKAEPDTRDVPIVVATMQSPESWETYAAAVASWVRRPFGSADLLDAVVEACSAPSILVVEDDIDLARVMTAILQGHGIRTFHASNGREAVDLCRQHEPSLIVLDLVLPDMDGFAVVSSLKESATLRQVPLLVYSGMDVGSADQKRLQLGPTEFLTKSRATLQEFEAHVVRLLETITSEKEEAADAA